MTLLASSDPKIFESYHPYRDFFCQDHRGWIIPDINKVRDLAQRYDFVLANCSTEHWGAEQDYPLVARCHDLLTEHYRKNFICLSHDPADSLLRPNIMYFPYYALKGAGIKCPEHVVTRSHRTYLFSNLNRVARDFRIANYLWMRQKCYADRCFLAMHDIVQENHDYDGYFKLTESEIDQWHQIRTLLPNDIIDHHDGCCWMFDHPALGDTWVHLVSETCVKPKILITEKTWQTVAAGQIFLVWGNAGIVAHLKDLGVDVFDDIVNHDYDCERDHRRRLEMIHSELDRLASLDWPMIYHQTVDRRRANSTDFSAGSFVAKYIARLNQAAMLRTT